MLSIMVVLGNFNKYAPPWTLHDRDSVASDITFQIEDDPISFPSPFLTIHPDRLETFPVVMIFLASYFGSKMPGYTLQSGDTGLISWGTQLVAVAFYETEISI